MMRQLLIIFLLFFSCTNLFGSNSKNDTTTYQDKIEKVKREFPNFRILTSEHYIIVYQTSRAYAEWYRMLLDNIYLSFTDFWKKNKAIIKTPENHMVIILYASKSNFEKQASDYLERNVTGYTGWYSRSRDYIFLYENNRMATSTKTNTQSTTKTQIAEFLKRPGITNSIDTLIHEGAHQLSFNTGLLPKNCPDWIAEGVATIRGTPQKTSRNNWKYNLNIEDRWYNDLRQYLRTNPKEPILSVIKKSNIPFGNKKTLDQDYAMACGLTFYLLQEYPREFIEFLKTTNTTSTQNKSSIESRQEDFEKHFGKNWKKLQDDFTKKMIRLR